ncbi:dephospho-CoA kinase [Paucilactobacillus sp. N302-9]
MLLGLTGGIATGKSTVSTIFKERQIPVVDADVIAHQVVAVGSTGLKQVITQFGKQLLNADGSLNRTELGRIVFNDSKKLTKLNQIMQPLIKTEIQHQVEQLKLNHDLIILDAPLLFEQGYDKSVDQIMVVSVPAPMQLQRLMERDHIDRSQAMAKIQSQMSLDKKVAKATIVIDNSGTVSETKQQVLQWLNTR